MTNLENHREGSAKRAPLLEQRAPVLFMLFLLIVSGVTASVVGYRVKTADIERKAQLLKLYESYGGSFQSALAIGTTIASPSRSSDQNTFIYAYEVNSRARAVGLYQVLEASSDETLQGTIQSLFNIGATEAARSTEDAWRALKQGMPPQQTVSPNAGSNRYRLSPKALRFAKQYDRYVARDTEVKLFRFARERELSKAVSN